MLEEFFQTDRGDLVAGFIEYALTSDLNQFFPVMVYDQTALEALIKEISARVAVVDSGMQPRDNLIREATALSYGLNQLKQAESSPKGEYSEPPKSFNPSTRIHQTAPVTALSPGRQPLGSGPRQSGVGQPVPRG